MVSASRKFFVGGNFKMNGTQSSIDKIINDLNSAELNPAVDVVIAPPAMYLLHAKNKATNGVTVSAQNIHQEKSGAFTGELSAMQLQDAGIPYTLVGHSERRTLFHETDEIVAAKTASALAHGIKVILCIGETLEEREGDVTNDVLRKQMSAVKSVIKDWTQIVVAYEPVWAIGTGKVASHAQAQDAHKFIRSWLAQEVSSEAAESTRIIYGGSANAGNCKELGAQADIDGFLVGGASLKPEFSQIVNATLSQ